MNLVEAGEKPPLLNGFLVAVLFDKVLFWGLFSLRKTCTGVNEEVSLLPVMIEA